MPPTSLLDRYRHADTALTLLVGGIGGTLLAATGMPGAWIAGSMIAVACVTLSGVRTRFPKPLSVVAFTSIGISMGSGVTPDTVARLPTWPVSLVLVILSVPIIAGAVYAFLTRRAGWDGATALLSAMPGGLSFLLAIAPSTKADIPRVATLQSMRVALLVALLPVAAIWLSDPVLTPIAAPAIISADEVLLLLAAGVGGAALAHLIGVPAGLLVGGLAASAALHGSGIVCGAIPDVISVVGFIALGALIGTRFANITWRALGRILATSLESFAISLALASAIAVIAAALTGLELLKLLLAFAPGGLEAMVVLAFALDLDPAFVAAHHLARFLLIALAAPFVFQRLGVMRR